MSALWFDLVCALVEGGIGGLLLMSGVGKLFAHADLLGTIAAYRILPRSAPYAVFDGAAWALALAEIACGAGLALGFSVAALASAVLFAIFAVAVAVNMLRGRRDIACGCAIGSDGARISWTVCFRAAGLAATAAILAATAGVGDEGLFVVRATGILLWVLSAAALRLNGSPLTPEAAR